MTIHGAQGSTADTCHTVITGAESREQLYVALTRGRHDNHVHVTLPGAADEHAPIRRDSLIPPAATDLLLRVLARSSAQRSATTELRTLTNPARRLRDAITVYLDALGQAPTRSTTSDAPSDAAAAPAPLPWLPAPPRCDDPAWTTYLTARAASVTDLARAVAPDDKMPARCGTGRDQHLRNDLAIWTATHPADDRAELSPNELAYLRHLAERRHAVSRPPTDHRRWEPLAAAVRPSLARTPYWSQITATLSDAFDRGVDVDRAFTDATANPDPAAMLRDLLARVDQVSRERSVYQRRPDSGPNPDDRIAPAIDRGRPI